MINRIAAAVLGIGISALPAAAQNAANRASDDSNGVCIQHLIRPSYLAWKCDNDNRPSDQATVVFVRTALTGSRVSTVAWHGPEQELTPAKFAQLVGDNETQAAPCRAYFHAAHVLGGEAMNWNQAPEDATKWFEKEGRKRFPALCYTADATFADFILLWADATQALTSTVPFAMPQRSTFSGMVGTTPYWGAVNSTAWVPIPITTQLRSLSAVLAPVVEKDGKRNLGTAARWSTQGGAKAGQKAAEELLGNLATQVSPTTSPQKPTDKGNQICVTLFCK